MIGAIIGSVVAGVASAAVGSALAPKPGAAPDYGQQTTAGIQADLATLPLRRRIEAAARLGIRLPNTTNPALDFTGKGDADIEAGVAAQLAPQLLAIQQRYGTQFIDATKAAQEQADPEGTAARKMLAAEIEKDLASTTQNRPVADLLDSQMTRALSDGRNLGADAQAMIAKTLASRGGDAPGLDMAAVNESAAMGSAGTARANKRNQNAMAYLSSGQTPEDVNYKRQQQALSNASAFLAGRTPQSEFSNMKNAQQGATPQVQAPALTTANPNAGSNMASLAAGNYSQNLNNLSQQVNPWFTGLSAALQGVGTAGAAGWKPLA